MDDQSRVDDPWGELSVALLDLEQVLRSRRLQSTDFLRDAVALDLAVQVLEAGRGVEVLRSSPAVRLAYAAARYALEASQDVLFLLLVTEDAERLAARAFVTSWRASLRTGGLMDAANRAYGLPGGPSRSSLREMVEKDASELDHLVPSAAEAIRKAASLDVHGVWHWSG